MHLDFHFLSHLQAENFSTPIPSQYNNINKETVMPLSQICKERYENSSTSPLSDTFISGTLF